MVNGKRRIQGSFIRTAKTLVRLGGYRGFAWRTCQVIGLARAGSNDFAKDISEMFSLYSNFQFDVRFTREMIDHQWHVLFSLYMSYFIYFVVVVVAFFFFFFFFFLFCFFQMLKI